MKKIKILIADDMEDTRKVIKKILTLEEDSFEVVGEAGNGEEVLKLIPKVNPEVILMDINMPVLNGFEATEKITNSYPKAIVIIMSVQGENQYLKKAMFHGAKEYIIKPFNSETIIETIKSTYEKYSVRNEKLLDLGGFTEEGKIIGFFSSKGGVGKSVMALNTAIIFSRELKKKTLLMDFDLQFGDISMMVNGYREKTILNMVEDKLIDSYDMLKPYLYKYNESLDIAFAPEKPEAAEYIGKDIIETLIKTIKTHYEVIIIDTGINFNDGTLYILDNAQKIIFMSTMEIIALKNTKLGLKVMESLGYDENKVKLVINRETSEYGIGKRDVEEVFKGKIFAMFPEDLKLVATSINKGEPFCEVNKFSKLKLYKAVEGFSRTLSKELFKVEGEK